MTAPEMASASGQFFSFLLIVSSVQLSLRSRLTVLAEFNSLLLSLLSSYQWKHLLLWLLRSITTSLLAFEGLYFITICSPPNMTPMKDPGRLNQCQMTAVFVRRFRGTPTEAWSRNMRRRKRKLKFNKNVLEKRFVLCSSQLKKPGYDWPIGGENISWLAVYLVIPHSGFRVVRDCSVSTAYIPNAAIVRTMFVFLYNIEYLYNLLVL